MSLLRGAGYQLVGSHPPEQMHHAGVGGLYAHVTAPLRRLVDRYASTLCVELAAGRPAPDWIVTALPGLPALMAASDQRAGEVERAVLDMTEAWLLADRVGQTFPAVVLDTDKDRAKIALDEPPVRASAHGDFTAGKRTKVKLVEADVAQRLVRFEAA
jgi:exoribonuclease R